MRSNLKLKLELDEEEIIALNKLAGNFSTQQMYDVGISKDEVELIHDIYIITSKIADNQNEN